jgi:membrane protein DedA with SNARE-associated domain
VHLIEQWLTGLPPLLVYLVLGAIIFTESMGVPLPGEIILVTSSIMAASGVVDFGWVAAAASLGAILGDSVGYAIGRRGGRAMLERLGRRFPKHLGPPHLARAEDIFGRYGVWAVFFGRFVALLRVLAGPLAGALHVPYRKFLLANAAGGVCWAAGTSFAVYAVGRQAEKYLKGFSWIALAAAVVLGIATTLYLKRRTARGLTLAEAAEEAVEDVVDKIEDAVEAVDEFVEDLVADADERVTGSVARRVPVSPPP